MRQPVSTIGLLAALLTMSEVRSDDISPSLTATSCRLLTPAAWQGERLPPPRTIDQELGLAAPSKETLFRLESDEAFQARLRQEYPQVKNVQFPKDAAPLPEGSPEYFPFASTFWVVAPTCYRPLYFEDKRVERFGRYTPCLQPLRSMSKFYIDMTKLPCRFLAAPPWTYECDNR